MLNNKYNVITERVGLGFRTSASIPEFRWFESKFDRTSSVHAKYVKHTLAGEVEIGKRVSPRSQTTRQNHKVHSLIKRL